MCSCAIIPYWMSMEIYILSLILNVEWMLVLKCHMTANMKMRATKISETHIIVLLHSLLSLEEVYLSNVYESNKISVVYHYIGHLWLIFSYMLTYHIITFDVHFVIFLFVCSRKIDWQNETYNVHFLHGMIMAFYALSDMGIAMCLWLTHTQTLCNFFVKILNWHRSSGLQCCGFVAQWWCYLAFFCDGHEVLFVYFLIFCLFWHDRCTEWCQMTIFCSHQMIKSNMKWGTTKYCFLMEHKI